MKSIMIVSLSAGLLGEDFVSHEVDIGVDAAVDANEQRITFAL